MLLSIRYRYVVNHFFVFLDRLSSNLAICSSLFCSFSFLYRFLLNVGICSTFFCCAELRLFPRMFPLSDLRCFRASFCSFNSRSLAVDGCADRAAILVSNRSRDWTCQSTTSSWLAGVVSCCCASFSCCFRRFLDRRLASSVFVFVADVDEPPPPVPVSNNSSFEWWSNRFTNFPDIFDVRSWGSVSCHTFQSCTIGRARRREAMWRGGLVSSAVSGKFFRSSSGRLSLFRWFVASSGFLLSLSLFSSVTLLCSFTSGSRIPSWSVCFFACFCAIKVCRRQKTPALLLSLEPHS